MPFPIDELAAIESNFDVNDHLIVDLGSCTGGAGEGKLRFLCIESHLAYEDPILYPGETAHAHLHQFYGNTLAGKDSTYQTLRETGDGTCQGGPINRTGYWYPAVIRPQNNMVVKPALIELYYHVDNRDFVHDDYTPSSGPYVHETKGTRHFPNGLAMIFGWQTSEGDTPSQNVWHRTAAPTTGYANFLDLAAGTADVTDTTIPATPRYGSIHFRIASATCWNGLELKPADGRSHLKYTISSGESGNPQICPASHPFRIPQISVLGFFSHEGEADFTQWYIASDQGHGPPEGTYDGGTTLHVDWYGAWDTDIQAIWEGHHLAIGEPSGSTAVTSSGGNLCDGTALEHDQRPTNNGRVLLPMLGNDIFLDASLRYSDIPEVPGEEVPGVPVLMGQACM